MKMKVAFICERGMTPEIGTGHYYRSKWAADFLRDRGHNTSIIFDGNFSADTDVLVVDDLRPHRSILSSARDMGIKTVLIDGVSEDVPYADLTISAFFNPKSQYRGIDYMSFLPSGSRKFNKDVNLDKVFVSMGGFDANNIAPMVLGVLHELGLKVIITKSINHANFTEVFPDLEVYEGEDYYLPMSKCMIGVVNGGLTMFQALHFGLPSLAIPQYDHQRDNIQMIHPSCFLTEPNKSDIRVCLSILLRSKNYRNHLSDESQKLVDGKAISRVCDLIEELK